MRSATQQTSWRFTSASISRWLALVLLALAAPPNVQAACPSFTTGGTATKTIEYYFFGPSFEIAVDTIELVGEMTQVFSGGGQCQASCTLGVSGTCALHALPTMTQCSFPNESCLIPAGNTVLLTSAYIQDAVLFKNGFE